jgi:hypothetical protein
MSDAQMRVVYRVEGPGGQGPFQDSWSAWRIAASQRPEYNWEHSNGASGLPTWIYVGDFWQRGNGMRKPVFAFADRHHVDEWFDDELQRLQREEGYDLHSYRAPATAVIDLPGGQVIFDKARAEKIE